jgi:hypothetical protein
LQHMHVWFHITICPEGNRSPSTSQNSPNKRQDGLFLSAFVANTESPHRPPNNIVPANIIMYGTARKSCRSRRAVTNLNHLSSIVVRGRVTSSNFAMG